MNPNRLKAPIISTLIEAIKSTSYKLSENMDSRWKSCKKREGMTVTVSERYEGEREVERDRVEAGQALLKDFTGSRAALFTHEHVRFPGRHYSEWLLGEPVHFPGTLYSDWLLGQSRASTYYTQNETYRSTILSCINFVNIMVLKSDYSSSDDKRDLIKRLGSGQVCSTTRSPEPRRGRSESPRKKDSEIRMVFKRLEKGVFHRLGDKGKSMSAYSNDSRRLSYHGSRKDTESCYQSSRSRETEFASEKRHNKRASSRRMEPLSGSKDSVGGQ
nr:hypothetical protein [Tanacetum cinerariifolium]